MPKFLMLLLLAFSVQVSAQKSRVAIVIDDIGYRYTDKQALTLPGDITFSFLPHTPYAKTLAFEANALHRDVLLHIPMESKSGKLLGPGALTSEMNESDIHQSLKKSLDEIPFAIGINNHMGSYLTTLNQPMTWTMHFLKSNGLLFLDSKTSAQSTANNMAQKVGVPVHNRHIFLDNNTEDAYIAQQFQQLIEQAQENDMAIAIAHPHPKTIATLKRLIPTLKANNIELVPLSALYQIKTKESYSFVSTE